MRFGVQFNGTVAAGPLPPLVTHSWNAATMWCGWSSRPDRRWTASALEWKVQNTRQAAALVKCHRGEKCSNVR